ncbi:hypothetical protein RHGRI_031536 [Rhododendron griersonianum]|uniref:Uncharacterized protein n=1 Tax=Rhododendron griersonianum TaxID=479676 RepID=A0AAV6I875_9ERIC|nr:hypothetical protein RHGRI_031536 [Rhododendron griersonianum]
MVAHSILSCSVRRIILLNNSFHGPILEEIGRLFRLQFIRLSNNSFGGGLPNNLSRCSNLEYLYLDNNHLSGNIPTQLGSLPKLRDLILFENKISGTIPPSIGNLSYLVKLAFSECNLHGEIPEGIAKLRLLIQINQLEGSIPPDIGSKLPNLASFTVFDNQFTGMIPNPLSNASGLGLINFGVNNFIGPMPEDLGELSDLPRMNFQHNQLEDDLSFISSQTNCTRLQFLLVNRNLLKGSLPDFIANLSIDLSFMVLGENQLHGSIPSGIGNLLNLTVLSMKSNYFSGPIPDTIGRLRTIPNSLSGCSSLEVLHLEGNSFEGEIPQEFGVGDMASTNGDVYSFGILLLEMFTGKRPTDSLFQDHLNLHNFVKNALPERVMDIVDPSIQLEHNNGSWINDCMVSILTIGVACSSESPRDRMEMETVVSKLCAACAYPKEKRPSGSFSCLNEEDF